MCPQHGGKLKKGLQEVLKAPTVVQQTFLVLVSWKIWIFLSALLVIRAGNSNSPLAHQPLLCIYLHGCVKCQEEVYEMWTLHPALHGQLWPRLLEKFKERGKKNIMLYYFDNEPFLWISWHISSTSILRRENQEKWDSLCSIDLLPLFFSWNKQCFFTSYRKWNQTVCI